MRKSCWQNAKAKNVAAYEAPEYTPCRRQAPKIRPVVAGFGPGGMFAALVLSMAGLKPIVLERGADAETRRKKVEAFRAGGELDPECNVQFGEGGAGTFFRRQARYRHTRYAHPLDTAHVLRARRARSILYDAKPHIGTDILINVVQSIRKAVIAYGGEVRFNSKLTGLVAENNTLRAVRVTDETGEYENCPAKGSFSP